MKRTLLIALTLLSFTIASAQHIDTNKELKIVEEAQMKISKASNIKDAACWVEYANICANAYMLPSKGLYVGLPEQELLMLFGEPMDTRAIEYNYVPAIRYYYEYTNVYLVNSVVCGWKERKNLGDNLVHKALKAYETAYSLDSELEETIALQISNLERHLERQAEALYNNNNISDAAKAFELAHQAHSILPSSTKTLSHLYNSGMLYATAGSFARSPDEAVSYYMSGESMLNEALRRGYADNGDIYYYLYKCYFGQYVVKDCDTYFAKAKEALLTGIKLYPKNDIILDALIELYIPRRPSSISQKVICNPVELVNLVESLLKENPTDYDLWFSYGHLFFALENYDECIALFKKCVELRPNTFEPLYYTGSFIILKANALLDKLSLRSDLSGEEYNDEEEKINLVYAEAIPWLEKAHSINPTDGATIEYLNSLCFRLRDMDGMMDKYNKYHELFINR